VGSLQQQGTLLERQGTEDFLLVCQGSMLAGIEYAAMEPADGWCLCSYGELTIIMCGQHGYQCHRRHCHLDVGDGTLEDGPGYYYP
jgi:hypothetical protein